MAESKGFFERRQTIVAAVITGTTALLVAYLSLRQKEPQQPLKFVGARITGRILNAQSLTAVSTAKVSLEVAGVPPLLRYPDTEGVFDFGLPRDVSGVRLRVEAPGFQRYDRWVNVSSSSGIEEIRLEPNKAKDSPNRQQSGSPSPVQMQIVPRPGGENPSQSSLIDETLRPAGGHDGPWAVVVFGGRQDRRADVASWLRSALAGSGHDSVALFRRVSDEQRVAPELYRGSSELYSRLQAGRFVSRILVAQLTVVNHPGMDGLLIAEAKVSVHVLSPAGELLKDFAVSEKGSGFDIDSAQRNAINELEAAIQRELPVAL